MAEAFRITAEDHPDRVAVRTKDDEVSLTWGELRDRVDALAGGLAKLGVKRGDTVALMFANRPEFHIADLAVMTLGATPFSIYATYSPEQIQYVVDDAGAQVALIEEAFLDAVPSGARELPDARARRRARGRARRRHARWATSRAPTRTSTPSRTGARRARRPAHADLHVGHDRAAEGRPAHAHEPDGRGRERSRTSSSSPTARASSPGCPPRTSPSAPAHHYLPIVFGMTVTTLPEPARDRRLPAGGQADLVLRRPAHLGEAARRGLEGVLAAERRADRNRTWLDAAIAKVELEQAGEAVPAELAEAAAKADESCSPGCAAMLGLDEAVAVNVGAAPTPPEVLVFFHAIGIPLGRAVGDVGDLRRRRRQPARTRSRSAPSARRRRASRSGSPTTARC